MSCLIQIALVVAEAETALQLARRVAPWVGLLEAGTPLIKSVGLGIVRTLRLEHPDKLIVADMKSTDVGGFEARLAFDAGADFTTTVGLTPLATIASVQSEADRSGRGCIVDLTGVEDVLGRSRELQGIGVRHVLVHRSIDEELSRGAAWSAEAVDTVRHLCETGFAVSVAGGLGPDNLPLFRGVPIYAAVVGRAITGKDDPAAAAQAVCRLVGEIWPT
jgi:3-hexulose-6-phosphate synthase